MQQSQNRSAAMLSAPAKQPKQFAAAGSTSTRRYRRRPPSRPSHCPALTTRQPTNGPCVKARPKASIRCAWGCAGCAAISIFKELLQGPETEAIKMELKWLTKQLGPARDFDVLLERSVNTQRRVPPISGEIDLLESDLQARLDAGLQKAKAAVDSDRYRALGLRTALWVANGEWSTGTEPLTVAQRERRAVEFAADSFDKRSKKILKKIANIEALDTRQRHKLRIAVKKLRYACEFFAGLFDSRKQTIGRKRLMNILKSLQGSLGTLNDFEVHKRLAVTIAHPRKRSRKQAEKALAMGFIAGQEQQQAASCINAAEKTGKQLSNSAKFWQTGR